MAQMKGRGVQFCKQLEDKTGLSCHAVLSKYVAQLEKRKYTETAENDGLVPTNVYYVGIVKVMADDIQANTERPMQLFILTFGSFQIYPTDACPVSTRHA